MLATVVTVEPTAKDVKAAVKLAKENTKEVKAFKVRLGYVKASAESPVFSGLYDYSESEGLPVLFHTGDTAFSTGDLSRSHPLTLDGLANKREELTMILCHFGNPWFEDVAELIYKHPNVYTDISGLITGSKAYEEDPSRHRTGQSCSVIRQTSRACHVENAGRECRLRILHRSRKSE